MKTKSGFHYRVETDVEVLEFVGDELVLTDYVTMDLCGCTDDLRYAWPHVEAAVIETTPEPEEEA